jgi:hypothetical protein
VNAGLSKVNTLLSWSRNSLHLLVSCGRLRLQLSAGAEDSRGMRLASRTGVENCSSASRIRRAVVLMLLNESDAQLTGFTWTPHRFWDATYKAKHTISEHCNA